MSLANEIIEFFSKKNYPQRFKTKSGTILKYYNEGIVAAFPALARSKKALVISVGIHGDETGAIEYNVPR